MIQLSYSLNGLTHLNLLTGISVIENAGYAGFEFSFQKSQFNPFVLSDKDKAEIKEFLKNRNIKPICISTATTFFLGDIPHEPSLLNLESEDRQKRIDLIKKGIDLAVYFNTPIVSFQSGYIREEHLENPHINPRKLLVKAIKELLNYIGKRNIILVIEPEPGMYIESSEDGVNLIEEINSPKFKLHMDLGHVYCSEDNMLESIKIILIMWLICI